MYENYQDIKCKYDNYIYTLKQVFDLVTKLVITKEQFHSITGYNYDGLKENRGWL